jgi:hypothetical protein
MNPLSEHFNLALARRFLEFAIQFTPQCAAPARSAPVHMARPPIHDNERRNRPAQARLRALYFQPSQFTFTRAHLSEPGAAFLLATAVCKLVTRKHAVVKSALPKYTVNYAARGYDFTYARVLAQAASTAKHDDTCWLLA